jgi:hypothetical protein
VVIKEDIQVARDADRVERLVGAMHIEDDGN